MKSQSKHTNMSIAPIYELICVRIIREDGKLEVDFIEMLRQKADLFLLLAVHAISVFECCDC